MRNFITFVALLTLAALPLRSQTRPGVETLRDSGFDILKGKRIGLITNPTGVDTSLTPTVDILAAADSVYLTALFAPEHGIRGDVTAGAKVSSTTDPATGIPVHSIYGRTKAPTPAMLDGLDALVYDIQDNGCRSYTFISTMGLAMEAAANAGLEFIVLDRPNPLGGLRVEGGGVDSDCISFVSQYDIPYIYGLTPGELALYLKGEGLIKNADRLRLTVIPMQGWSRDMTYEDTGMPWVLPSPHMPASETCLYYPASGIAGELDFISIGVGYPLPFKTFAAPWIDRDRLARHMNGLGLDGVRFRTITYKPYYGRYKGETCHGVEMYIEPDAETPLTLVQFYVMEALAQMYPDRRPFAPSEGNGSRLSMFDKVTGSRSIRTAFSRRYRVADIMDRWNDNKAFLEAKQKYHLYN